jgi:hypothetical protein
LCHFNNATSNYKLDKKVSTKSKVVDILDIYIVGTEKTKFKPAPPRNVSLLGPLRYANRKSSVAKAASAVTPKAEPSIQTVPAAPTAPTVATVLMASNDPIVPMAPSEESTDTQHNMDDDGDHDSEADENVAEETVDDPVNDPWKYEDYARTKMMINEFCCYLATNSNIF